MDLTGRLLCIVCLLQNPTPESVARSAEVVVEAPGSQLPEVITFLAKIRDGFNKSDRLLENLLVSGRVSQVSAKWTEDAPVQTADTMPPRNWYPFRVVQRGAKRRYDQVYHMSTGKDISIVRLMDEQGCYLFDETTLSVGQLGIDIEETWANLDETVASFEKAFGGNEYLRIPGLCQSLIDQLEGRVPEKVWQASERILRCHERDGMMTVESLEGPAIPINKSGYHHSFSVDSRRGFRLIERKRQAGAPSRGLYYTELATIELSEVRPGVYFPKRGMQMIGSLGTVVKNEENAGWSRKDFEVDRATAGDFAFDDSQFSWMSLPIPQGAHVEDRRTDPALTFTYGKSPLEQQLLEKALRRQIERIPGK